MKLPPGVKCMCGSTCLKKVKSSVTHSYRVDSKIQRRTTHVWYCLDCYTRIETLHYDSMLQTISYKKDGMVYTYDY